MSEPIWKDVTSYSRGDAVREPRTFELRTKSLRITVTKHIHCPGWNLLCYELGMVTPRHLSDDLEKAKKLALVRVRQALRAWLEELKVVGTSP